MSVNEANQDADGNVVNLDDEQFCTIQLEASCEEAQNIAHLIFETGIRIVEDVPHDSQLDADPIITVGTVEGANVNVRLSWFIGAMVKELIPKGEHEYARRIAIETSTRDPLGLVATISVTLPPLNTPSS